MQYDLVEIRPKGIFKDRKWCVDFSKDDRDRESSPKSVPYSLGFYHYPRNMGKRKAFGKLKRLLVGRHKEEIAKLEESLRQLEELKCD